MRKKKAPFGAFFAVKLKLVRDSSHQRIFGLRNVEARSLNNDGLVAFNENGIGGVLGDLSAVISNYLVETDVVGALVLANGVDSAHRLVIFEIEGYVDVCILTRKIEHADSLVADKVALLGITHKSVGNKPYIFSVHNIFVLSLYADAQYYIFSISFKCGYVKTKFIN